MQRNNKKSQAGNVFVIIMAGIFLFGALMFTFSKSSQKGSGNLSKQQAKIAAQEILSYANLVEGAVDRVRRNGCSENEISFNNAVVSGYSNPNAPVDGSCDIFAMTGGKIDYIAPQESWLDKSFSSQTGNYGTWRFVANVQVDGIGTNASELRITLNFLNKDVCLNINNSLGIDNPSGSPPVDENDSSGGGQFIGTFSSPVANNVGDDAGHNLSGKSTYCREGNSSFQFMNVLLAR